MGIDGKQLYNEWKAYLKDYGIELADVKSSMVDGLLIEEIGFANYYPRFHLMVRKVLYLSIRI
ncbi:MAG: hypothetical protein R2942_13125 [Ignavibacteria bacterium]